MTRRARAAALAAAVVLAACGGDDGRDVRESASETGTGRGSATGGSGSDSGFPTGSGICVAEGTVDVQEAPTLDVTVRAFEIEIEPTTVDGGAVSVEALNIGQTAHELLVVRADDVADLPLVDGALDEDALAEGDLAGRIEGIEPETSCPATFELDPGRYLLICNVVEGEGAARTAHLAEGMVTAITVT